ncbi:hypothetical protein MYSTI_00141 [Myxococcus stipitatus DSM 14675]|uniref:EcxA zinc-binding domain-containing protein n=1 Tax=Myxococcus stipitatus (strain DSM 14675 / JCM 12634 / Mx s8) TaxID=1278073 RepID=L7U0W2_MYXSD|nr:zinc-dependent metalloprotease [Myxococcus stipitatus]AGC41500.1 hypothetical protein MYSTI_00141 [Myxococcus stipitatus DSM 14675]
MPKPHLPLLLLLAVVGCGESGSRDEPEGSPSVALDAAFVAIPRESPSGQHQKLRQALSGVVDTSGTSFYLAIRKSELGQRWFFSAYWKQAFPGGLEQGAATSLGTRVVTFKEQNGKLFVLDADDRKKNSDVFDPTVLVDAYPIIFDFNRFNRLPGADLYLLIDPTAGTSRITPVSDALSWDGWESTFLFEEELAFAQRFRRIEDGVTYEKVFTGTANQVLLSTTDGPLQTNSYRLSGTLGMALRRYQEGPGFTPTPMPDRDHYFSSESRLIPDTSVVESTAAKWNIHPGMKPIAWHITPSILTVQALPRYQQYDLVGAVKRGVENWNQAFGFTVFEAFVGDSSLGFADDDKNVVIFDTNPTFSAAFANWRTNPNTGEIRGASIYMNAGWIDSGEAVFGTGAVAAPPSAPSTPSVTSVSWAGMAHHPLCVLRPPELLERFSEFMPTARSATVSPKESIEHYVTFVVMHEIGHTLSLQHNFAGSLASDGSPGTPPSSSVMDYLRAREASQMTSPGTYDVHAVRYLYGLAPFLPVQPFCTHEDLGTDPSCNTFDQTSDPLTGYFLPTYQSLRDGFLISGVNASSLDYSLNGSLQFVRDTTGSRQASTYALVMDRVRPPLQVPPDLDPVLYGERADTMARRVLSRLYLDSRQQRGLFTAPPSKNLPELNQAILTDVRGIVLNVDGVRGHASRRAMVEILKLHQSAAAYLILREARTQLTAQLPSLSGTALVEAEDLLARIHAASSPYYL